MEMAGKRPTVIVSRDGIRALEEPRFLIEADGKLYLTVAVLEYDPKHPELKDEHRDAIAQLQTHLQTSEKVPAVKHGPGRMSESLVAANAVGPGTGDGGDSGSGVPG
jgi:hypothetical protein